MTSTASPFAIRPRRKPTPVVPPATVEEVQEQEPVVAEAEAQEPEPPVVTPSPPVPTTRVRTERIEGIRPNSLDHDLPFKSPRQRVPFDPTSVHEPTTPSTQREPATPQTSPEDDEWQVARDRQQAQVAAEVAAEYDRLPSVYRPSSRPAVPRTPNPLDLAERSWQEHVAKQRENAIVSQQWRDEEARRGTPYPTGQVTHCGACGACLGVFLPEQCPTCGTPRKRKPS